MSLKSAERTGIMPIGWSAVRQKVKLVLVARLPVAGDDRLNGTSICKLPYRPHQTFLAEFYFVLE